MTLKNFIINYFSPFYFIARFLWLVLAFFVWALLTGILVGSGWNGENATIVAIIASLVIVWNALRPWKIGVSYNEAAQSFKILEDKIKNRKK